MTDRSPGAELPTRRRIETIAQIKTVLFDLDGTLLKLDSEAFFPDYFGRLARHVAAFIPPETFTPRLLRATQAMVDDKDPARSNQEVFMADFFADVEAPREVLMPHFNVFYETEFPKLRRHSATVGGAREVVERILDSGRRAVIATSPLFPRVAVDERLRWAGLDDLPFALVTTYENMHACKPHPEFYAEILEHLGCQAKECVMVGNDVEEDLVAGDVGMATYLVDQNVINRGKRPCAPDYRGPLTDLPGLLGSS